MSDRRSPETALKPVTGIRVALQLDLVGIPGAASLPFLAEPLLGPLAHAANLVANHEDGEGKLGLVLLDAHRSREAQAHLFEAEVARRRKLRPELSEERLRALSVEQVEDPEGTFAFGTGGAVGVTLAREGRMVAMGSAFGEHSKRSHRRFFRLHPPQTSTDRSIEVHRRVLHDAMTAAGFVAFDSEWWRYELLTPLWARLKGRDTVLDRVLAPSRIEGPAARPPMIPGRYGARRVGASSPFLGAREGKEALAARPRGHHYARFSHPDGDALEELLRREIFTGEEVKLCVSGLAAAQHAVRALMPERGGVLMHAADVYHGCKQAFRREGQLRGWRVRQVDSLLDPLQEALERSDRVDVVYVDSPSNWNLRTYDLPKLASAVHKLQARLVVDVTLQPCQPALREGADVLVSSLSKDVSLGHTIAGALSSNDRSVLAKVEAQIAHTGELVTMETAQTIYQQAVSLPDRLVAQAPKMEVLERMLHSDPGVSAVHVAEVGRCGGLPGSQMAFRLVDPGQGTRLEQVIGHRSLDPNVILNLGSSFGATLTLVEHFASRLGADRTAERSTKPVIAPDLVRIGLGCQDGALIVDELAFALEASRAGKHGQADDEDSSSSESREAA
jgi:cystathionine beta-lyase/cystathionine gamma-synthase/D-alanyl-D-alanine dipeptidase